MLLTIDAVGTHDLADLMPMMRDYCDFYRVDPSDERLLALVKALIDNPADGVQLIARGDGTPLGFATIFWTWQTLYAARVGVLNALYVVAASRGAPGQHHGATALRRDRRGEVFLAELRTRRLITARSPFGSRGRPLPGAHATMTAMWRVGRLVLTLLLVTAFEGPAAAATPEGQSTQAFGQPPMWSDCSAMLGDASGIPTAQCGTVSVPVDYTKPQGAQAQLAVIRIPASGDRIGALVVNPGGPGASAVDTVADMGAALVGSPIMTRFDLVGIDPRGVGHSTPELRCRTDAEFDAFRRESLVDYSPDGIAHIEAVYGQIVNLCVEKMGTEFLANVGTANAVQDMDVVRAALGDNQISYLGFSYGTRLGAAYADRYPDRVRAMVLDSAIDPSLDPIASRIRQYAGFQQAFDDYAADCAQSSDCPLGTDPTQFVNRFHDLVNPLVDKPGYTSDPRGLSYQDAITGTVNALYSPRYWQYLTSGLLGLQRGTDAGDLLLLADDYQRRNDAGHYQNQQDAFTAIGCVDSPYPTDPAVWAEADRQIRQAAPFLAYGDFTGFAPRDLCTMWPVPPTSSPHPASSPGPGKVVVVAVTRDPATPYQSGVDLAQQNGASLITFDGTQHTVVFTGDACVDTAVVNFLVDSTLPPPDLRC